VAARKRSLRFRLFASATNLTAAMGRFHIYEQLLHGEALRFPQFFEAVAQVLPHGSLAGKRIMAHLANVNGSEVERPETGNAMD